MKRVVVLFLAAASVPALALAQWCDEDVFWAEVAGDQVTVHHQQAEFNCCPVFELDIVRDGFEIDIFETELESPCDCNCCFDFMHVLVDLEPGVYTARVWGAYGCDPDPCGEVSFFVGNGTNHPSAFSTVSDCGGWQSAEALFADGFERGDSSRWSSASATDL